jgi:hypothetical protein
MRLIHKNGKLLVLMRENPRGMFKRGQAVALAQSGPLGKRGYTSAYVASGPHLRQDGRGHDWYVIRYTRFIPHMNKDVTDTFVVEEGELWPLKRHR